MKLRWTAHFVRAYGKALAEIQTAFRKQPLLLLRNLRHPSRRTKKHDDGRGWWQARVTQGWRFYFAIREDAYILQDITGHPK
jgi:plasmid maintenance system killer protein